MSSKKGYPKLEVAVETEDSVTQDMLPKGVVILPNV